MLASPTSQFSTQGTKLKLTDDSIIEIECNDGYKLNPTSSNDVSCLSCESEPVNFLDMACIGKFTNIGPFDKLYFRD